MKINFKATICACLLCTIVACGNDNRKVETKYKNSPLQTYAVVISPKKNLKKMDTNVSDFALVMKDKNLMIHFRLRKNTKQGDFFDVRVRTWEVKGDTIDSELLAKGKLIGKTPRHSHFKFDDIDKSKISSDSYRFKPAESSAFDYQTSKPTHGKYYVYMTYTDDFHELADSLLNAPQYEALKEYVEQDSIE